MRDKAIDKHFNKIQMPKVFTFSSKKEVETLKKLELKDIKEIIWQAQDFEKKVVGKTYWYLGQIFHYLLSTELYKKEGYKNFFDFAKTEFGYKNKSMIYKILKVFYAFNSKEAKDIPGSLLMIAVHYVNFENHPEKQLSTKDTNQLIKNRNLILEYIYSNLEKNQIPSTRELQSFINENIRSLKKQKAQSDKESDFVQGNGYTIYINRMEIKSPINLFEDKILQIDLEYLRENGHSVQKITKIENEILNILEKYNILENAMKR